EGGQISAATLYPEVWVADTMQMPRARELHEEAHRQCFIARSMNFPITLELPDQHQMPELPKFSSRLGAPIAVLKPRRSKKPSQVSRNHRARLEDIEAEHTDEHQPLQQDSEAQQTNAPSEHTSFYEQVGGEPTF